MHGVCAWVLHLVFDLRQYLKEAAAWVDGLKPQAFLLTTLIRYSWHFLTFLAHIRTPQRERVCDSEVESIGEVGSWKALSHGDSALIPGAGRVRGSAAPWVSSAAGMLRSSVGCGMPSPSQPLWGWGNFLLFFELLLYCHSLLNQPFDIFLWQFSAWGYCSGHLTWKTSLNDLPFFYCPLKV